MKNRNQKNQTSQENSSEIISYFLLKNKGYRLTIPISTIVALVFLTIINFFWPSDYTHISDNVGIFVFHNIFSMFVIMLLTSLSGYVVGSFAVAVYFSIMTMHYGIHYYSILLLIASLISNIPVIFRWYKSIWKTILATIMFAFILGIIALPLVFFLYGFEKADFLEFAQIFHTKNLYVFFFIKSPFIFLCPSLLVTFFCYVFFNFFPQKIRKLFLADSYSSDVVLKVKKELKKSRMERNKNCKSSNLGSKLFCIFIVEALVLFVASLGFSSALLDDVNQTVKDINMILYITRFFFLMLLIAAPLISLIISSVNVSITNPITLMAKAVEDSSSVNVDGSQKNGLDIHSLKLKSNDEIGILYNSLVTSADNTKEYIERIQREQELKKDLAVAEAATKAKSAFLSNMSHEIRTPINAVLGLDEMILRESQEKETLQYALDIQNAGKSLLSLVNDILDFSKIEAGKMEIIPVEYDLSSTINDLVNMISKRAEDKGLELNVETDENLPHLLYGDEIRIKQCAINILTNAVKYTEKGSVNLSFSFEKLSNSEINLTIHVKDTGIGIKKEDLSKLFVAFQRIEEKRNRTIEGTGLGMNITQQLLNLMGTSLQVESEYGKGSDFYFTVKQQVVNWESIGNFADSYKKYQENTLKKKSDGLFTAPNANVLVVDDTPLNLTVIRGLLKRTKINVETAESGAKTLSLVTQKKYDVIFIDHRMPVMDGIETLQAMKTLNGNLNQKTPCIALTANAVSGAREMYLQAGFTDYLTKPVDSVKLEKMLIEYLPKEKVILNEINQKNHLESENENTNLQKNAQSDFLEKLSSVEGVDVKSALTNCGDEEVLSDAIKDFYNAIDEKSNLIEKYKNEGDIKNYTILVHALKSSARLVGISKLSELAKNLEKAGDENDIEKINQKTSELLNLYRSYKEKFADFVEKKSSTEKKQMSQDEYKEAISNLQECIEAFDFETADQIISMIDEYNVPESEQNQFEKIKKAVQAVDQNAVLDLLRKA